jgi:hypothetical protein
MQVVAREEVLDDVAAVAQTEHEVIETRRRVALHDVPEDRPASDLDHRLRSDGRLLAETGAMAACEDDDLHDVPSTCTRGMMAVLAEVGRARRPARQTSSRGGSAAPVASRPARMARRGWRRRARGPRRRGLRAPRRRRLLGRRGDRASRRPRRAVLTVLAGDPEAADDPPGSWDEAAGFTTAAAAAAARREEDRAACEHLGARPLWLPFWDRDYGLEQPEPAVREELRSALAEAETVLVPGWPLWHEDHLWVAEQAPRLCPRVGPGRRLRRAALCALGPTAGDRLADGGRRQLGSARREPRRPAGQASRGRGLRHAATAPRRGHPPTPGDLGSPPRQRACRLAERLDPLWRAP